MNATDFYTLEDAIQEKETYNASQGPHQYNEGLSIGLFVAGMVWLAIGVYVYYELNQLTYTVQTNHNKKTNDSN